MQFHVIFSGQSSEYIEELKMLALHPEVASFLKEIEPYLVQECAQPEIRRSGYCPHGILPWSWASGAVLVPPASDLIRSEVSQPMLFITAIAHAIAARLFPEDRPEIKTYSGHSQGIVAALFAAQGRVNLLQRAALVARYLLWQGIRMQNSCGWFASADFDGMVLSPMLAITGLSREEIHYILGNMPENQRPSISLRNAPDRHVLSGNPRDLALFLHTLRQQFGTEGRRKIWFDAEPLAVSGAYHCPLMAQGRHDINGDLFRLGLDFASWPVLRPVYSCQNGTRLDQEPNITRTLMDIQYTGTVDWPATLHAMLVHHPEVHNIVIPGPGAGLRKLTASILQGTGVHCVASPDSRSHTLDIRCTWPQVDPKNDTHILFSSRFTERTGKKPMILAGMTPTTATSRIVAAAANAGYVAELAGGGQVTEKIFRRRMEELAQMLNPGAAVVLNTLYLDPYLFDLHMRKLLFKLRKEGFPLRGFTLTAGVPSVDEARALLEKAAEHEMDLCSLKVGTPEQIEQVIAIAKAVPEHFIVIQLEGGEGGGHHGWYSLQNLLHRSYLRLRELPNVAIAAGGGVRDAEDVKRLLSGAWYEGPGARPLDAVLVGTLAMACAEAETSPAVKAALVEARGTPEGWPGTDADVVSGKSSLGASIWYLRNTAAQVARLADEVTSQPERLLALRETLQDKMNRTAKPYFGDLDKMTYAQWLTRFVELTAIGKGGPFEHGVWLSEDHEQKFLRIVKRVRERLGKEENSEIDSQNPFQTVETLVQTYSELQMTLLEPDRAFFLQLCDEPGKPMPFVPILDPEIRRRYLSDSLFYSHDERFDADAVLVIPGPRAVGGITCANKPVAQLFDELLLHVECAQNYQSQLLHRYEIEVNGSHWLSQVAKPWSTLLLAGRMHGKNDILPNPLNALVKPQKGDRIVVDASEFVWLEQNREKLRLGFTNIGKNRVEGVYFMKMAGGDYIHLPLVFEFPDGWNLPRFEDDTFFTALNECYKNHTFLDPVYSEEYAQALGRPTEYRGFAFLPWYASASLARMVNGVVENPLGLLHYRSRVQIGKVHPAEIESTTEIRMVEQTGMQARCHFLASDHRVLVEVDGEFASRHPSRFANLQPLSPSSLTPEEYVFESDVDLGETYIQSPANADMFALCGGDRNPLHADAGIARLAGFGSAIHHGLWTQAAVVTEIEKSMRRFPRAISRIQTRFLGPVPFDAKLKMRVLRRGRAQGRHLLRAVVENNTGVLAEMDLHVEAHPTAYICPGQGVQKKGMHEPMYSTSKAAREIWDRADTYTREHLGFSLLHVVRENPVRMEMLDGVVVQHPEGVLQLTQFTQVALVVFSCAAVARLREIGAFVHGAHFSGHSLGEYSALSAIGDLLSLEDVVRVVYHRGLTMQHFVPRDARGESPFRMGVIRPNHAGITEQQMFEMVADIARVPDQYIEIVNYNCRGKQYAVTGYKKGLHELRVRLGSGITGKAPYVEVPGIDVPFHSSFLREGVDAFRKTLDAVFPQEIDPRVLEKRYWPNLTGKPFELKDTCIQDVLRRTRSDRITNLADRLQYKTVTPSRAARELLVEMLAYQFASPVQWIDIQEGMTRQGIKEIVEIGPGHQPTLMNLFAQTLAGMKLSAAPTVLHLENHFERIVGQNAEDGFCEFPRMTVDSVPTTQTTMADNQDTNVIPSDVRLTTMAMTPPPARLVTVSVRNPVQNGLETLLATLVGAWPEELDAEKSIEDLLQGNSARRNQMLSELQKEFGLKKVDGLADLPLSKLADTIISQTTEYRFPGPTLTAARREMFSLLPGLTIEESVRYLTSQYALDVTCAEAVVSSLCAYAREGKSKLTGAPNPFAFPAVDAATARSILDAAAVRGLGLSGPAPQIHAGETTGTMVDAGALREMHDKILGPKGVLGRMGALLDEAVGRSHMMEPTPKQVRVPTGVPLEDPIFDESRIVLFTAANNWIREQALRLVSDIESGRDPHPETVHLHGRITPEALHILETARNRSESKYKEKFETWISKLKNSIENPDPRHEIQFEIRSLSGDLVKISDFSQSARATLVVTGAGPKSIAEGVVRYALLAGWDVISGVSRLDDERVRLARTLYQQYATQGARMWLVPMRQGNFDDIDAFARWTVTQHAAKAPLILLPFAAIGKNGMSQDTGAEHEIALRVNLLGVERLVGKFAEELAQHRDERIVNVILPMSPNQGDMGGDGIYGESKIALRALLNKWRSEPLLRKKTRMAGAIIGWVRSTGLMHGQDDLAFEIEKALGVKTFDTTEMGSMIFQLACVRADLENPEPITADCTGGLSGIPDWGEAFRKFRASQPAAIRRPTRQESIGVRRTGALPFPRRYSAPPLLLANHPKLPWQEWIVVVGYSEIGPFGDEEARWEYELDGKLRDESILHIALMTGLAHYDRATGEIVESATKRRMTEKEAAKHFESAVYERVGIRWRPEDGQDAGFITSLEAVTLDEPRLIPVDSLELARQIQAQDPTNTECVQNTAGQIYVKKLPGAKIYIACRRPFRNWIAGMLPSGWNPAFWGFSESEAADRDRNTLMMLVATARALHRMNKSLAEITQKIHPSRIGNTLGSGIGGMERLIRLYTDPVWNRKRDPISLQESLGNVGAGHVSQELLGNYGPMVSPVGACATAGISVETAWEKLRLNRADLMVAGAFDDISYAGTIGFDDMSATVDAPTMERMGIPPHRMSRPHDRRRKGFVESQGGGTLILMRAGDAVQLGLPIYGVVGHTWSFGDGFHQSIPAPGFGMLSVARGGSQSELARALSNYGLNIDDIGVVSLHGTSTPVNDPHETGIFQQIFEKLGRTPGNPVLAISQKAVTGHTKGGASALQIIGVLQMMRDHKVPGHRNLDDLDDKQQRYTHFVFPAQTLDVVPSRIKAALVSTLGFGHVSSLVLMLHPGMLLSQIEEKQRQEYLSKALNLDSNREMEIRWGLRKVVQIPKNRPFEKEEEEQRFLLEESQRKESEK